MAGQLFSETLIGQLRKLVGPRELPLPAVRIVLEDPQGRVLLGRRSDNGFWALPGGYCDPGESAQGAIRREVAEETGLTVPAPVPFGFSSEPEVERITYPNGDRVHSFTLLYYARAWEGTLTPADGEMQELVFHSTGALPDCALNDSRTVELYLEFRRSGAFQAR